MRDEDITTSKPRETINRALTDRMNGLFDKFKQAGETDAAEEVYKTDVISLFQQVIEAHYQILQKRKEKSNNDDLSQSFDDRVEARKSELRNWSHEDLAGYAAVLSVVKQEVSARALRDSEENFDSGLAIEAFSDPTGWFGEPLLNMLAEHGNQSAAKIIDAYNDKKRTQAKTAGKNGASKRHQPMDELKRYAVGLYKQKKWNSANEAAFELQQQIINHGKTINANLKPSNAQRTIAEWFRKSV